MSNEDDFPKLLATCGQIAEWFPDGLVFIGGIAVYLHAINHTATQDLAEATHDGDFYISLADMGDLRDLEEVTPNRRLSKHQLIKNGFEFDIYTERQSRLIVPYDQVAANAVAYDQVRVACIGDLVALKLEAYRDRRNSAKGLKDAKDLVRLSILARELPDSFNAQSVAACLSEDHLALLEEIARGPAPMEMARGNAVTAMKLRAAFTTLAASVTAACTEQSSVVSAKPPQPRNGG